jgi:anti-anti-sigma factor
MVEHDRARTTLRPVGELDLANAGDLAAILDRECSVAQDCELDLAGITFIDCAGLRALCDAYAGAQRTGCRLRLLHPSRFCAWLERRESSAACRSLGSAARAALRGPRQMWP